MRQQDCHNPRGGVTGGLPNMNGSSWRLVHAGHSRSRGVYRQAFRNLGDMGQKEPNRHRAGRPPGLGSFLALPHGGNSDPVRGVVSDSPAW